MTRFTLLLKRTFANAIVANVVVLRKARGATKARRDGS